MPQPQFIHGIVLEETSGDRLAGVSVVARAGASRRADELGRGLTGADGRFRFALNAGAAGVAGQVSLTFFYRGAQVEPAEGSEASVDRRRLDQELAICLPALHACEAPDDGPASEPGVDEWTVYGSVRHRDGTATAGLGVRAFSRAMGGGTALAAAVETDSDGAYQIIFAAPGDTDPPVHVFVEVRAAGGDHDLLATSRTRFAAGARTRVDVQLVQESLRRPSEYARVSASVDAAREDVAFGLVSSEQVEYLAGVTGLDVDVVRAYVAAGAIDDALAGSDCRERVFGLVRSGWPLPIGRFLQRPTTGVAATLSRAADRNLVSRAAADAAAGLVSVINDTRLARALDPTTGGVQFGLLAVLDLGAAHDTVIARWHQRAGTVDAFWSALRAEIGDNLVERVERGLALHAPSAFHPPLVERALAHVDDDPLSAVAAWSAADWDALLDEAWSGGAHVGVPDSIEGATPEARRAAYVSLLRANVEDLFPAARFRADLLADEGANAVLVDYFSTNISFDVDAGRVEGTGPQADAARRAQRLARLAAPELRWSVVSALYGSFGSARDIARRSRSRFVGAVGGTIGTDAAARVHAAARRVASFTAAGWALAHPALYGTYPFLRTLSGAADLPDYDTLFGSADTCACDPCLSIMSPASYLVDLLAWVEQLEGDDPPDVGAGLGDRRRDLELVELSCDNTYRVLPYIDLVNEVLETAVLDRDGHAAGHEAVISYVRTTLDSSELVVTPEYVVRDDVVSTPYPEGRTAYDLLDTATGDRTLPFHRWNHQARVFLGHLGVPRPSLLAIAAVPGVGVVEPGDAGIDAMGLCTTDVALIASAITADGDARWGYDGVSGWEATLCVLRTFLNRSGLDYAGVLDLLHGRAANPGVEDSTERLLLHATDPCDITAINLVFGANEVSGVTPGNDALVRLDRVLRAGRALGLGPLDADRVLHALGVTGATVDAGLDEAVVKSLGWLRRLGAMLDRPLVSLLPWFSTLDTYADRDDATTPNLPLYDRLFLNPASFPSAASDPDNWVFKLNGARDDLEVAGSSSPPTLAEYTAEIAAALGVARTEVDAADAWAGSPALNLAELSAVVRRVDFARVVGAPVDATRRLLAASGLDPFASPREALQAVEHVRGLLAGGYPLAHALYVAAHDSSSAARAGISADRVREDLGKLRDEIRANCADFATTGEMETATRAEVEALFLAEFDGVVPGTDLLDLVEGAWLSSGGLGAAQDAAWTQLKSDCFGDANLRAALDLRDFRAALIGRGGNAPEITAADLRFAFAIRMVRFGVYRAAKRDALRTTASQGVAAALGRAAGFGQRLRAQAIARFSDGVFLAADDGDLADLLLTRRFVAPEEAGEPGYDDIDGGGNPGHLPSAVDDAIDLYVVLQKVASLFGGLGLSDAEEAWWFALPWSASVGDPRPFNLLDVRQLEPWASTSDLRDRYDGVYAARVLFGQRARIPGSDPSFAELLTAAQAVSSGGLADFATAVAERTDWETTDVSDLATGFGYTAAGAHDLTNAEEFRRLVDALLACRRLGVAASAVFGSGGWFGHSRAARAYDAVETDADGALATARSRYPAVDAWSAVARPLRDAMRVRQRDALVAWLLHRHGAPFETPNDLFAYYLIDVEMSPCQLTSRVKQACSSVQTYLQRNVMGFDAADLSFDEDDVAAWEWKKSYGLWEAAVQVFLYPENWIDPTLRPVDTPLFDAAERAITQGQLTSDRGEEAVAEFVRGLAAIGSLYPATFFREALVDVDGKAVTDADGAQVYVTHVVARTKGEAKSYYYRQLRDGTWSPWEEVKAGVTGGHLALYAASGRMFVVWVEWGEGSDTDTESTKLKGSDRWRTVRFHWAQRTGPGNWGGAQCSDEYALDSVGLGALPYLWGPDGTVGSDVNAAMTKLYRKGTSRTYRLHVQSGGDGCTVTLACSIRKDFPLVACVIRADGSAATVSAAAGSAAPDTAAEWYDLAATYGFSSLFPEFQGDELDWGEESWRDGDAPEDPDVLALYDSRPGYTNYGATDGPADDADNWIASNWLLNQGVNGDTILVSRNADEAFPASSTTFFWSSGTSKVFFAQSGATAIADPDELAFASDLAEHPFQFSAFYHPYATWFDEIVSSSGSLGLLFPADTGGSISRQQVSKAFFEDTYAPNPGLVSSDYPDKEVSFTTSDAYAAYNWELFFHLPMLVATRLAAEQRYQEALDWLHCVFDPRNQSTHWDIPDRYWKVRPFLEDGISPSVTDWLAFTGATGLGSDIQRDAFSAQIAAWEADPFDPHVVAALRPGAYQKWVFMTYLDTLIAWGDQLFAQDTMESVNEATTLYVLAQDLLGERPVELAGQARATVYAYANLPGGAPLEMMEDSVSALAVTASLKTGGVMAAGRVPSIALGSSAGASTYFCVPKNPKLLAYWDTVADRLFKIRSCMDLAGTHRQLALYEPPLDPALLVRASALGVDIGTAIAQADAALPNHRFSVLLPRAQALAGTVRAFGGALLSALEKKDAEALAQLRSSHEVSLLAAMADAKELAVTEAEHGIDALDRQRTVVEARRNYYAGLLAGGRNAGEDAQLGELWVAAGAIGANALLFGIASVVANVPDATVGLCPGVTYGGANLVNSLQALAQMASAIGQTANAAAAISGLEASWARRDQEWVQQRDQAKLELDQLAVQRLGAEARLAIAEKDKNNLALQQDNAATVDAWMRSKFTNAELYGWMAAKLSALHLAAYDLAVSTARKAEACYRHELGVANTSFVRYAYWDSLKNGLLAGESLGSDLDRMDAAYLDADVREHELTKHVALSRLDPFALERLRAEGECYFAIPEEYFDLDCPGHYFRRLSSVAVSLESVGGRDVAINLQLTLHRGIIRRSADATASPVDDGYGTELPRITTSTSSQDAGVFQLDLRDPRYVPFERRGAVSQWHAKLTARVVKQINWHTINDLVLHLRYTARDGGDDFASAREASLEAALPSLAFAYTTLPEDGSAGTPLVTPGGAVFLFSAKRDDPDNLYAAQDAGDTGMEIEVTAAMLGTLKDRSLARVLVFAPGASGVSAYTLGNWSNDETITVGGVSAASFVPDTAPPTPAPSPSSGVNTYAIDVGVSLAGVKDIVLVLVLT